MSAYIKKIEKTSYVQEYAHCHGQGIECCEKCFRRFLSEELPKMGINRMVSIKPVMSGEKCILFVDKACCRKEVHEVMKRVELYKENGIG